MTIHAKHVDTIRDITLVGVRVADVWQECTDVYAKKAGTWELVHHATVTPPAPAVFSVSMLVGSVSGSRSDVGSCTSSAATAVPVNGTAPYTYSWTKVSGATLTVTSPTAISTTFAAALANGEIKSAVYKVTATDNDGAVAEATVNVSLVSAYVAPPSGPVVVMAPKGEDAYANIVGSGDVSLGFGAGASGGTPPYTWVAYTPDGTFAGLSSYTVTRTLTAGTEFSSSIGFAATDANGLTSSDATGFTLRALTP